MVTRNPWKPLGKQRFRAIVQQTIGSVLEGLPAQACFRTVESLWKANVSVTPSPIPVVSQLVRGLASHGFPKALETLWKIKVPGYTGRTQMRLARRKIRQGEAGLPFSFWTSKGWNPPGCKVSCGTRFDTGEIRIIVFPVKTLPFT